MSKFIGETKGNSDLPINRSTGGTESPSATKANVNGKFVGDTKGNSKLPTDLSSGVSMGHGGKGTR